MSFPLWDLSFNTSKLRIHRLSNCCPIFLLGCFSIHVNIFGVFCFYNDALIQLYGPPSQEYVCNCFHSRVYFPLLLYLCLLQQSELSRFLFHVHIRLHSWEQSRTWYWSLLFPFVPNVSPPAELSAHCRSSMRTTGNG